MHVAGKLIVGNWEGRNNNQALEFFEGFEISKERLGHMNHSVAVYSQEFC